MNGTFLFIFAFLFSSFHCTGAIAQDPAHSLHQAPPTEHNHQNDKDKTSENENVSSHKHPMGPIDCSEMEFWDYSTGMCMPLPMPGMPMTMAMIHGNAFLVGIVQEGPRGRDAFASPNMIMGDVGTTLGERHYVSVNLMLTFEKWTFPKDGYPELFQIGEENQDGVPYIDAQHPHSSPIMGLTFSDTIKIGSGKDHLKLFFSARGQATDGPVAFMHRPTGIVNPDAPLGHHIGQDVSHITSTVLGASLGLNRTRIEASTFNGREPEPAKVDLPLGTPNSYAVRLIQEISDEWTAMGSAATVKDPEPHDPDISRIGRYSVSIYDQHKFSSGWMLHNTFVFGLVNGYDHVSALRSFLNEFWLHSEASSQYWGRIEFVERTPNELAISGITSPNDPRWVTAATLGYTYRLKQWSETSLKAGGSITKNFLPSEFQSAYGGDPWSGRVFLQVSGMKMEEL